MGETEFKRKVLAYLRKNCPGAWIWKTSDRYISGVPDVCMVWKGKSYWLELKTRGGRVAPIQDYTIKCINKVGGIAGVCWNMDDVKQLIKKGEKDG